VRDFEEANCIGGKNSIYILKPPDGAEGRGIRVISKLDQVPKDKALLLQRYIQNPLLIDGRKFDLRIYCAVTSFDPLRIYVYEEGLTRFASHEYSHSHGRKSVKDRFAHLTNYTVNKKSKHFVKNVSVEADGEGNKWSLTALWRYLEEQGHDVKKVKENIHQIMVKALIAVEPSVVLRCNTELNKPRSYKQGSGSCFELFGFDILLDTCLKAWLIEVAGLRRVFGRWRPHRCSSCRMMTGRL